MIIPIVCGLDQALLHQVLLYEDYRYMHGIFCRVITLMYCARLIPLKMMFVKLPLAFLWLRPPKCLCVFIFF